MRATSKLNTFLKDNTAISEEFTVIPALCIVMVGFALFVALMSQTYITFTDHMNRLQNYQTADRILQRLTRSDCFFVKEAGLIDIQVLLNDTLSLQTILEQYKKSGIVFFLRFSWDNRTMVFPETLVRGSFRYTAVSKEIALFLNEAQTTPGALTVFLWEES